MWPSEVYVMTPIGLSPKTACTALLSTSSWTHDTKRQLPSTDSPACAVDQTEAITTIIANPKRRPAGGPLATDAEAAQLYRTMVAYSGTYTIDGNKVVHEVEVSWNQAWNGTDQQRFIEVKDNRLTIKSPTMVSPISGKKSINTLVWERMK